MADLLLESDDGVIGGVDQDPAIAEAEEFAFDLEHDGAVDVEDFELAFLERHHLPHHRQIHRVGDDELRADHRRRRHRLRWVRGGYSGHHCYSEKT